MTSSSALLGIVLTISMFGAGIVTERLTNVYITNFPVDEQGNLRITTAPKSKIMLVFNQTINFPSSVGNHNYLASFNTSGYTFAYITAKLSGSWQTYANLHIYVYEKNFGIRTHPEAVGYMQLDTGPNPNHPTWGCGSLSQYKIHSMQADLYFEVYNSDIGANGLLTIAVHLTN